MLQAIWMHFHTEEFPELWKHICTWVKTSDQIKFDSWWEEMQTNASVPQSFVHYLKVNWMGIVPLLLHSHWTSTATCDVLLVYASVQLTS